ncbi:hypothetical protein Nepgr_011977 [Nepenthes gracilis]|uniref:Uncharacterized protein n=1 Tax=Nepenthes gracilis TaxID=150966 RepID=A0AAD3SGQ0_NEPGR|nr:hypothetical protein Nepgr_011977 [Nepenthes gracilis]
MILLQRNKNFHLVLSHNLAPCLRACLIFDCSRSVKKISEDEEKNRWRTKKPLYYFVLKKNSGLHNKKVFRPMPRCNQFDRFLFSISWNTNSAPVLICGSTSTMSLMSLSSLGKCGGS